MDVSIEHTNAEFKTGYLDKAIDSLPLVIERSKQQLANVDFDTIVGTGFSGGIVIPALAMALEKKFVLIRKDGDDSHHGGGRLLGSLGRRWIFVDDLIASGSTRNRVLAKISEACEGYYHSYACNDGRGCSMHSPYETTYVGSYMYGWHDNRFHYEDAAGYRVYTEEH